MLDLTIHKFTLFKGDVEIGHFSNLAIAIVTGVANNIRNKGEGYFVREGPGGPATPVTDYTVDNFNGALVFRPVKGIEI